MSKHSNICMKKLHNFTVNNISFRLFYLNLMIKILCTKIIYDWIIIFLIKSFI